MEVSGLHKLTSEGRLDGTGCFLGRGGRKLLLLG